MNKKLGALVIAGGLLAAAVQLTSCKKEATTVTPSTPKSSGLAKGKCSVTASLSGAHSAEYKSAEMMSMVLRQGFISINSSASGALTGGALAEQFVIYLPLDIKTGTFNSRDFPGSDPAAFTYTVTDGSGAKGYTAGADETSVNFTLTRSDTEGVEGTFEGAMGEDEKHTTVKVKGTFAARF